VQPKEKEKKNMTRHIKRQKKPQKAKKPTKQKNPITGRQRASIRTRHSKNVEIINPGI
jgi:hypothetical protein